MNRRELWHSQWDVLQVDWMTPAWLRTLSMSYPLKTHSFKFVNSLSLKSFRNRSSVDSFFHGGAESRSDFNTSTAHELHAGQWRRNGLGTSSLYTVTLCADNSSMSGRTFVSCFVGDDVQESALTQSEHNSHTYRRYRARLQYCTSSGSTAQCVRTFTTSLRASCSISFWAVSVQCFSGIYRTIYFNADFDFVF